MEYVLIRSRRKSISIQVNERGEVIVRAPLVISRDEVDEFVRSKMDWINKHRQKIMDVMDSVVKLTYEEIEELADKAMTVIPERCKKYAGILGVRYRRITIRNQRTRWGSCSSKGGLNFNCLLMLCPDEVIDYVVVHELCHLREMNHSSAFWQLVESVMPDYKTRRMWQKEHGPALLARLP